MHVDRADASAVVPLNRSSAEIYGHVAVASQRCFPAGTKSKDDKGLYEVEHWRLDLGRRPIFVVLIVQIVEFKIVLGPLVFEIEHRGGFEQLLTQLIESELGCLVKKRH